MAATSKACAPPRSPISARSRTGSASPKRRCWWLSRSRRKRAGSTATITGAACDSLMEARNRVILQSGRRACHQSSGRQGRDRPGSAARQPRVSSACPASLGPADRGDPERARHRNHHRRQASGGGGADYAAQRARLRRKGLRSPR